MPDLEAMGGWTISGERGHGRYGGIPFALIAIGTFDVIFFLGILARW